MSFGIQENIARFNIAVYLLKVVQVSKTLQNISEIYIIEQTIKPQIFSISNNFSFLLIDTFKSSSFRFLKRSEQIIESQYFPMLLINRALP